MVTCPRPRVFARPNILVASFATQARACILSDHNIFYTPRGGGNGGVMPLGLFLFSIFLVVTCPRPPVFARPNILIASFATQARACILSDHNYLLHPEGNGERRGNAPGAFLVFFLVVTCPRPPAFARPNKYSSVSFATQARAFILSDRNIFYTRGGEQRRGLMPLGLFLFG